MHHDIRHGKVPYCGSTSVCVHTHRYTQNIH